MKNYPLVSIVTPAFNQAEFLEETIKSVLEQTYKNIEYIVINDGSSDYTIDIINKYADKIIGISQDNIGQSATLNKGWGLARGRYLAYISSDDCLEKDAIEKLVATIESDENIVVAYGNYSLINESSHFVRKVIVEDYEENRLKVDLVCQVGAGAIFKREIFDLTGGWKDGLQQVPDFEFWLRASLFGNFKRNSDLLARYRIHEKSASFGLMNYQRSMEIVDVVSDLYVKSNANNKNKNKALSKAYLLAAKNNFQSNRYLIGWRCVFNSFIHNKKNLIKISSWRIIFSGLLRRFFYKKII